MYELEQAADTAASSIQVATQQLEQVSDHCTAMIDAIDEIARSSNMARETATSADIATGDADTNMSSMASAAQEINSVAQLINGIARQTNLLALNAAIEAARAGSAGRGFAVVADAVKELAQRSEKASNDIGDQIHDVQETTETCVGALAGIRSTVSETNISIATATEEQASTTRCIATAVSETGNAVVLSATIGDQVTSRTNTTRNTIATVTERAGSRP